MADKRITQLNPLSNPAGEDLFAVVDVDAQETKKTTYADLTSSLQQDIVNPITGSLVNTTYGLFNQTGSYTGVSASVAESSIVGGGVGVLTVPANSFKQGDAYYLLVEGTCNFHNNDTLDIKVKTDSIALTDTGAFTIAAATNSHYKLDINFSIHNIGPAGQAIIISAGTFMYTKNASTSFEGVNFGTENSTTFDTTIDNILDITAQFSSNLNVLTSRIITLTKMF
jgi:hypothetical protein